ncbi:hypothetical protein C2S53_009991 [Perilla frutescens var. hirtella]|uniref:Uncharacterized protein n=1 Tax=Perilla frutescens var. hirtella TaxID=608512 RepID=A0AAD4NX50_PERFH|nr:hypothetical protein C2S53_009991 [Perilla frutescens var. hirtella]
MNETFLDVQMAWQRIVVQHSEFCEWIREPGNLDEFVSILEHGGLHNMSSQTVTPDEESPTVEDLSVTCWMIPVGHTDDDSPIIDDDQDELDAWLVEYYVSRSTKSRLEFICKRKDICGFRLYAKEKGGLWRVQKFEDNHTCRLDLTHNAPRKMSSKVMADYFSKKIRYEGAVLKLRAMIAELLREYGIDVEYGVALRARNLAIEMVYGGVDHWARSQSPKRRYAFMTSNVAESFNARLLWDRRLPICSLIEVITSVTERWCDKRRELAVSRDHVITEGAYRKLSKQVEKRQFQLDQMPCSHATTTIRSAGHHMYDFVEYYYKQVNMCLTYHERVYSVPNDNCLTVPFQQASFTLLPSISVRQLGQLKEGRYRSSMKGSSSRTRKQQDVNPEDAEFVEKLATPEELAL